MADVRITNRRAQTLTLTLRDQWGALTEQSLPGGSSVVVERDTIADSTWSLARQGHLRITLP